MRNIEIAGNNFELEEGCYNFLQKYLDRITNFVKKNNLDEDLYQDILQRLADKLLYAKNKNGSIKEKECINIINQIGEPEDIFGDIDASDDIDQVISKETSDKKQGQKKFREKMINEGWTRDMDKALILGICNTLAEKTDIPVWIIRILLILFISAGGISIWIYLLLGIFMPVRGIDYGNKTTGQFFRYQLWALKSGMVNALRALARLIKILIKYIFDIILILFKNILPVLRFFFFGALGFLFLFKLLFLVGLGAAIFTDFSISNIEFTSMLPSYLMTGIIIGSICLVIFMVGSFAYAFNKKILNKYIFITTAIASFISLFFFIATGLKLFQDYSQASQNQKTLEIPVNTGSNELSLNVGLYKDSYIRNMIGGGIYIYPNSGDNIKIVIDNKVYAPSNVSQTIFNGMSDVKYESSTGYINIFNQGNQIFKSKVPFGIIERKISIYVPIKISLDLANNYGIKIRNVSPPQEKQKYYRYYGNNCEGGKIFFSIGDNRLVCENQEINKYGRRIYIQNELSEMIETIVPVRHPMSGRGYYEDWDIHSFNWIDENTVVMKIYDEYLNIFMTLNIKENGDKIEILDKKIKNIEQKRLIRLNTYKDISNLSGYNIEFAN